MTSYIYDMVDTWNAGATTFTAVKMNVTDTASNAASLLMDLQVGTVSKFKVTKTNIIVPVVVNSTQASIGNTSSANSGFWTDDGSDWGYTRAGTAMWKSGFEYFRLVATSNFGWGTNVNSANDLLLTRRAAANLRLGAADAAAPVAQTLSVQSVVAGTTNTAGTNLTITGSQGTGTGAGGSIIFQVAPAGSTGTAQNALATALTIASDKSASFTANVTIPASANIGFLAGSNAFLSDTALTLGSSAFLRWTNGSYGGTVDLSLARDAANTLALRNGTAAQEMRVYETTTGTIYKAILGNRQLIKIAGAAFDNGAGASAGTLTNAPAVGNPTKWIPIDDNGTTRHIPAW